MRLFCGMLILLVSYLLLSDIVFVSQGPRFRGDDEVILLRGSQQYVAG